ncbi:MAG TPA: thiamine-phosphate kinase [Candidatus Margulisiibacteriota bacterium]|nr:thiamine-phosphate kinase [Candidatus Margulisiibacteriota bacterium]
MLLKELGEFGLIERFRRAIKLDSSVVKGSGDDCAVIKWDKENYLLFTCDMIVEGVDFLADTRPELIGRKALAVSISDIASCGGIPRYAVVSLGLPGSFSAEKAEKIAKGIFSLARKFEINIVGGDLSRAERIVLDVSMLGRVEKRNLCLRSGAKQGDIIFVTGELGGSIAGKHLKFTPRLKEARELVKNFKVHAMIDISDGLAADLSHILKESGVGGFLYEEFIPQSKASRNLKDAIYSGEDFELLFTLSRNDAKKLLDAKVDYCKPIGEINGKRPVLRLLDSSGREKIIGPHGFRHF